MTQAERIYDDTNGNMDAVREHPDVDHEEHNKVIFNDGSAVIFADHGNDEIVQLNCRICKEPIHPARLEVQPRVVTCSTACSAENLKQLRRENAKRQYQRKKKELRG